MTLNKLIIPFLALSFVSAPVWALSSDKQKPVEVEADSFHLDDAKKTTVYTGNVIITQGSLEIIADKVTIYSRHGTTNKVIATGQPVKFKQRPDGSQELIRGVSNRFEYHVPKDTLTLTNQATLWQAGTTFSSERIIYNSKRSIVTAGDKTSASKRVKITLEPAKDE